MGTILLVMIAFNPTPPPVVAPSGVIAIQPLGARLPKADVDLVKEALVQFYGLPVRVLKRARLPKSAFYPPRGRYRAEKLLTYLETVRPPDAVRILGLTAADISTTKDPYPDWGVLGLASIDGTVCVISRYRAKKKSKGAQHTRERLAKVAVHEIGHTLGLDHCPTVGCLMEDAQGSVRTSDREYDLCPRCRSQLKAWGRGIPATPNPPWPRVSPTP